jgi:hypothetical protein
MLKKDTILRITNVYTANAFLTAHGWKVGAGSETEGILELYTMDSGDKEPIPDCPGGMMSFLPVPGEPQALVSIMGLFPPFIGKEAGIWLHQKAGISWKSNKVADLPFAHRCEFFPGTPSPVLVVASVSRYKENPADWNLPGEVYVMEPAGKTGDVWETRLIDHSITRNHGMFRGWIDGEELLCISGKEGVFSVHNEEEGSWSLRQIFRNEVSEMTFIDLDGDGNSEMVAIEPFHGSSINVYKRKGNNWELRYAGGLEFGHGLSSGMFNGTPTVAVGNRSGSLALEILKPGNSSRGEMTRQVIEEGVGPTQTKFFHHGNRDYLLSANQKKHEVALYRESAG